MNNKQKHRKITCQKIFTIISGLEWRYIKWKNLLRFIVLIIIIFGIYVCVYKSYEKSITTPSEPIELSFTIAPGGGGKNVRLVETPVSHTQFPLSGTEYPWVDLNLKFGPWDRALEIQEVSIHPIIFVEKDAEVEVTLIIKDKGITQAIFIGNFLVKHIETDEGSPILFVTHRELVTNNISLPAGAIGALDFRFNNIQSIIVDSDTYVWFYGLQAHSAPILSWWDSILGNSLVVGTILVLLSIFARDLIYETKNERGHKGKTT